jgi:hypothetical protein
MTHPARWSPALLDVIRPIIVSLGLPVHDPFAGTGERLGRLCDELDLDFSGTELEEPYIVDDRVWAGDATDPATCPEWDHVVVTSPVYPNGMADHYEAKDGSPRMNYRVGLARITGEDRPLAENNMGRYSVRRGPRAEEKYWAIAEAAAQWWPAHVVLNVSDFVHQGERYTLVERWRELLEGLGYVVQATHDVETPRARRGENHRARVEAETVLHLYGH